MRYTIYLRLGLCLLVPVSAQAAPDYTNCTALTRSDPQAALEMADEWSLKANSASAYHCRALALFALKRYHDAAKALDHLSTLVGSDNTMLWGNVLRQSGKAWELSGNRANAIVALTRSITVTAEAGLRDPAMARLAAEALLDRSQLYIAGSRPLMAVQDLDQAIILAPEYEPLLLARASLFLQMGDKPMAQKDLQALLQRNPQHAKAKELLDQTH